MICTPVQVSAAQRLNSKRQGIGRLFSVNNYRSTNENFLEGLLIFLFCLMPLKCSKSGKFRRSVSHLVCQEGCLTSNRGVSSLVLSVQVQYSRDRPDVRELPPDGLAGAWDEPHEALDERAWLRTLPSCQLRPRLWAWPLALPCAPGGSTTDRSLRIIRRIRLIRSVSSFCSL